MAFPLDVTFRIKADESFRANRCQDQFLSGLADQLKRRKARAIRIHGSTLSFTGPSLWWSQWNMLHAVTRGRVDVQADQAAVFVSYWLSFKVMFWGGLILLSVGAVFLLANVGRSALIILVAGPIMFLFVFSANIGMTLLRFSGMVRSQIDKALS